MKSEPINIKDLPLLLPRFKLCEDIQDKLVGEQNTLLGMALKLGFTKNTPCEIILNTIKESAKDNYTVVADLLGKELTDRIINFK